MAAPPSGPDPCSSKRTLRLRERCGATIAPVPKFGGGGRAQLERAIVWQTELEDGRVRSRAALAKREGLTRARVTQVMTLLKLPPELRIQVLRSGGGAFTEIGLRRIAMAPAASGVRSAPSADHS